MERSSNSGVSASSLSNACASDPRRQAGSPSWHTREGRIEGAVEELSGKIKAVAGKLTGNERTELEARGERARGPGQTEGSKAVERVKGKIEEVAGSVKASVGELVDDKSMELEGAAKKLQWKARQTLNR